MERGLRVIMGDARATLRRRQRHAQSGSSPVWGRGSRCGPQPHTRDSCVWYSGLLLASPVVRAVHVVTCLSIGLLACGTDDGSITDGALSDAGWVVHPIVDAGRRSNDSCDDAGCAAASANKLDLLFIV